VQVIGRVGGHAESDADEGEHGDRHVRQQQHLPRRDGEDEAARGRADGEADQPGGGDDGQGPHAQVVGGEQAEGQGHRAGGGHGRGHTHQRPDSDQLTGGGDERGGQARHGEQDQPGEHDATPAKSVGDRPEQQHRTAEDDGVGPAHPLQRARRGLQVAPDGGQGDVEDRVVEHLEEEDRGEASEGDPRLAQ
jgi:hypothetical protein